MEKIIILDSIRSMQNVWAIFRNADGSWFNKVILTWYCPYPYRWEIKKTALWAEGWIDWEYYEDIMEVIKNMKKDWFSIYSVELDKNSIDYKDLSKINEQKICLIMWNEVKWIWKEILKISDKIVSIPMKWKKESLNVSVAAWIVMYQFN